MPDEPAQVSNQEPVQPPEPAPAKAPEALTEDRIRQLIAEKTAEAIEQGRQVGRREMQSEKDQNVRDAIRRARQAEADAAAMKAGLDNLDEDTRKDVEMARYKSRDQYYQSLAQEEETRRQQEGYIERLQGSLEGHLKSLDIDPADKRLDYAKDEADFIVGRNRFDASVSKILKENMTVAEKKADDRFKEMERNLRKEMGLDSVDTSRAGAGEGSSEADFKRGIGDGSIPLTKETYERARKMGLV